MKILILTDRILPESGGGAQVVVKRLMLEYKKCGHEVIVAATAENKKLVGEQVKDGVKFYRFFSYHHRSWQAYQAIFNPFLLGKLKDVLKKERPDIVHAHNVHGLFSYYSLRLIRKMGIPIVITLHDCQPVCYKKFDCYYRKEDLDCPPKIDYKVHFLKCLACQKKRFFPFRNILVRHFLNKYPDKLVTVSRELKKLVETNGIHVSEVIYNGVDYDDFKIKEQEIRDFRNRFSLNNRKIVLFGGRLTEAKGGNQLLEAMKIVFKKEPRALLLVVAKEEGVYSEFLSRQAQKLGVCVLITGWLQGRDLTAAYYGANVVVTPSICFDTFGLMNIEAMACKKPVITSCFGGGKEIVRDNVSGYIVNPFDTSFFSEKILNIITNEELAQKMGEQGFKIVKDKFGLKEQGQGYLQLFEQL